MKSFHISALFFLLTSHNSADCAFILVSCHVVREAGCGSGGGGTEEGI